MTRPPTCPNCGRDADDRYCAHCGQSTREFKLPLVKFLAEFVGEAFALDSRLLTTIKPLFSKPGYVSTEFVAGRRVRFVPPIRLYIFASFAMFLTIAFNRGSVRVNVGGSGDTTQTEVGVISLIEADGGDTVETDAEAVTPATSGGNEESDSTGFGARFGRGIQRLTENPQAFRGLFLNRMAQGMFVLLPLFAVLLKLVYPARLYVEHLIFSVYFHAFVFLVVAVVNLPAVAGFTGVSKAAGLAQLGFPVYLFIGMRRMYGGSRARTALKFAALSVAYLALLLATLGVVFVVTLLMF